MYLDLQIWVRLMEWVVDLDVVFLVVQLCGGVCVFQFFDFWVGLLSVSNYRVSVVLFFQWVLVIVDLNILVVYFGINVIYLLFEFVQVVVIVLWYLVFGVDYWISFDEVCVIFMVFGMEMLVQGNIDFVLFFVGWELLEFVICDIVVVGCQVFGYVVNLGYGVFFNIDFNVLIWLVELVYFL